MASSSSANQAGPSNTTQYDHVKDLAFTLTMEELQQLREDVQSEINRRAREFADRQREEEERERKEEEETDSLYDAWLPKHLERSDRKTWERAERHQHGPLGGSATEEDSEVEKSEGFEYYVEEMNTSEEDSDAAEEKRKMEKYEEWKLRRRFESERANPKIFARTMQEGEPKVERQPLYRIDPRVVSDNDTGASTASGEEDDDENTASDEEEDDEGTSSGDNDTSPASSGSSYSEAYEDDEDWSYEDEDY